MENILYISDMKKKITIPTSYEDIKLGDLQRIRALEGDEEFMTVKVIEILTDIKADEALRMRKADRDEILDTLANFLENQPSKLVKRFEHDGREFGFNPNLNDMTWGEFVDIESYQTDFKNIHKLMAVLYRPVTKSSGKNYAIEPYEGSARYADVMKECPSNIALGAMVFFCALGKELLSSSQRSLREEVQRMHNEGSQKSGGGTGQHLDLLRTISQTLSESQYYHLNPVLPKLRTRLINMN
jgi:hypothetical protein